MESSSSMIATVPLGSSGTPFHVAGLPPATYALYLRAGEAVGRSLGNLDIAAGELRELGSIELPAPGHVAFDWREEAAQPGSAKPRAPIAVVHVHEPNGWRLWTSERLLEDPLELFPGNYYLSVDRTDGSQSEWPFEVASGRETWLTVGE
jgi:hypothetical protein